MNDILSSGSHEAIIGLGSNVGERKNHIQEALRLIAEIPTTRVARVSSLAEYAAEGVAEPQPDFLNGIAILETELLPIDLLEKLQIIERRIGRQTKGDNAPRPIDLDILSFGQNVVLHGKTLTLPHPEMHERKFVLKPLVEVKPDWMHPKLKKTASDLLKELENPNENRPVTEGV